ncbi:MAG: 50S ribosomal protein L11 methyltransferase [Bacteriovoracaceae bacterium]
MAYKFFMSDYFYIELDIDDENLMAICENAAFKRFNCQGSEDFSLEEEKVDQILGKRSYSGGDLPVEVLEEVESVLKAGGHHKKKLYFENKQDALSFQNFLSEQNTGCAAVIEQRKGEDWNENWKKSFKTIRVGASLSIIPSWEKGATEARSNDIFIYPGMGFGTGSHETTFLCLKLMLEEIGDLSKIGDCLDFGCGSGILGIALSAAAPALERVDYLDIDQQALDNSRQNIDLNPQAQKVKSRLLLTKDKACLQSNYDLVFANILLQTLLEEGKQIVERTKTFLVISGLLKGQEREVVENYQKLDPSLKLVKTLFKNDWSAALLKKTGQ